MNNQLYVKNN